MSHDANLPLPLMKWLQVRGVELGQCSKSRGVGCERQRREEKKLAVLPGDEKIDGENWPVFRC